MTIRKYLLFTTLYFCIVYGAHAGIGEWIDYQSYANAKNVVDTGDKIYCATQGGLFSYLKADNSISKISGINGLSDIGIQRLAYNKESKTLLIAYQNANIDLLVGNTVFNVSDIKRKQLPADKTINNILFSGKLAYLSCGFGIVVLDTERKEIKDTYFIGNEGGYLQVFDMATDGDFLYAATINGIYKARSTEPNLQDYNNWIRQTNIPNYNKKFNAIEFFGGHIIANYTPNEWYGDKMYRLENNNWTPFLPEVGYTIDLSSSGTHLTISSREMVVVYDNNLEKLIHLQKYTFAGGIEGSPILPICATLDAQNVLWIADQYFGLVKVGKQCERIVPQGPSDNKVFSLAMNGQDLWMATGGRNEDWNNIWENPKFQLQRNGKWTDFDKNSFPNTNDFRDIISITADPHNPDHFFAASWGGGVLEFNNGKFYKRHDNFNSSLQTQLPNEPDKPYVRIGGMAFDSKGNLWVGNSGVANALSVYQPDGKWKSYELSGAANKFIGKVMVTKNDDKWVLVPNGDGLYAMNSANNQTKRQRVVARFANNEGEYFTDMSNLYTMAVDNNGELWVGTSGGVAVFGNPEKVWGSTTMYATRPGLDLKDGKFHPLLEKETVTAIAIDGANRKWFGTKSSGVFLTSPNGDTEIKHFTTANSPLPNNEITDIAINQTTGEVFIGTIIGLISYMGEATKPNEQFDDVYVYPNPVRETYDGPIAISGLIIDSDVKITDINGNLVFKTTSVGGQAIWDGKNLNGNRCKTGIYLVFITDSSGEKTKTTKIMFVH